MGVEARSQRKGRIGWSQVRLLLERVKKEALSQGEALAKATGAFTNCSIDE